jgi:DNA-binding response OmpR family regulator
MTSFQKRVLVVEDEWLIGEYLADFLTDAGYDVLGPFPNVRQALDFLESNAIDIAVLDVSLGKEKSFPIAERLMEHSLPFIFLSGYLEADLPERMRNATLLAKPFQADQLSAALCETLRNH